MRSQIWKANFIVFVGSACTLIIELVAGRILAPYVGVSLYTWTSIIGVVLAGISLGNYLGGRIADRWASRSTLGILFFISGLASLSILALTNVMTGSSLPGSVPLVARILIFATAIFFVPSCVLGMISPLVVKLTLRDLTQAGNIVGQIYAFSAVGSIFGTFLTGFVLVSWLGTRTIIWVVAIVLLAMGVAFGGFWRPRGKLVVPLGMILIYGLTFVLKNAEFQAPCLKESNYYCIKVYDTKVTGIPDDQPVKALVLDHLVHSYVALDNPKILGYAYEKIYAELTAYLATRGQPLATANPAEPGRPLSTAFIGGGGYTFPRYIEVVYPGSRIDVVEIDPAVTRIVYEQLQLDPQTTIRTANEDARMYFDRPSTEKYDLVFGDAFNDLSVPYHLTTREFNEKVRARLKDDGLYVMNLIDDFAQGEFLRAMMLTLRLTFPHVYLFGTGDIFGAGASTYVVVASPQPLDLEDFRDKASWGGVKPMLSTPLPPDRLEAYLKQGRQIVLTDDYAPVDNLVAPLFIQRGL